VLLDGSPRELSAVGVGNDEQSSPLVAGAGVGCSHNSPLCRPPQVGKVSQDNVKSQSEVAADVLQDCESRSHLANGSQDVRPQMSFIVGAFPIACMRKRLARVTRGQDVHPLNGPEIHASHVAIVRDVRPVMVENLRRCRIIFDMPRNGRAVMRGHRQIQAAVPAEQ
jgi:hypothetical protein